VRIAIGGFQHETNTFSKISTNYQNFVDADYWPGMLSDSRILKVMQKKAIPISGFIDIALKEEVELVPLLWCSATPSGIVDQDSCNLIFTGIIDRLLSAGNIDAIYFDLHGAMVTDDLQDSEGYFLQMVRDIHPDIPIVISVDFHANLSQQMVSYCDRVVVYRTYPHVDLYETGQKSYLVLKKILQLGTYLHKVFYKVPYLVPMSAQSTLNEPCSGIYKHISYYEAKYQVDIEYAMGFPLSDTKTVGPGIIIYAPTRNAAEVALKYWKDYLMEQKPRFQYQYYPCTEAVKLASKATLDSRMILADTQDNPGCGGTSDTTGLAQEMIRTKLADSIIGLIYDPAVAKKAYFSGVGSTIKLSIGAKQYNMEGCRPIVGNVQVLAISNGQFTARGAFYSNMKMNLGLMALLKVGTVHIMVSSKKAQAADRAMFTHMGINLFSYRVIALKSSVHYQADFKQLSNQHLVVISPGANTANLKNLTYHHKSENIICI
jgi:microcystin degradation protein MlrC